jgi:predicted dehydrogenase
MTAAKYKAAIIGTGRMGGLMEDEQPYSNAYTKPYSHFMAYTVTPETEVVAVANRGAPRLDRFMKRFDVGNGYLDYREMILKEKPDIVSVTTPSFARAEPIIFAAENGVKGIYAEKGLCASLEEADRITAAVKANNVAFNWGASRRHHSSYRQMAEAIANGDIGEPRFVVSYQLTDLIKHHPHTLDTASMLIGDPKAVWLEGRLVEPDSNLDNSVGRLGPRDGKTNERIGRLKSPTYDPDGHRFVPQEGQEIGDPMVDFFRVGYENGVQGMFIPSGGGWSIEVRGTEGHAYAWEHQGVYRIRKGAGKSPTVEEREITPTGYSPTVNTVRDIVNELETGERTKGNIDVTMQIVEPEFAIAYSSLQDGRGVSIPVEDRKLHIPGG